MSLRERFKSWFRSLTKGCLWKKHRLAEVTKSAQYNQLYESVEACIWYQCVRCAKRITIPGYFQPDVDEDTIFQILEEYTMEMGHAIIDTRKDPERICRLKEITWH